MDSPLPRLCHVRTLSHSAFQTGTQTDREGFLSVGWWRSKALWRLWCLQAAGHGQTAVELQAGLSLCFANQIRKHEWRHGCQQIIAENLMYTSHSIILGWVYVDTLWYTWLLGCSWIMQQNACCQVTVAEATWSILALNIGDDDGWWWADAAVNFSGTSEEKKQPATQDAKSLRSLSLLVFSVCFHEHLAHLTQGMGFCRGASWKPWKRWGENAYNDSNDLLCIISRLYHASHTYIHMLPMRLSHHFRIKSGRQKKTQKRS